MIRSFDLALPHGITLACREGAGAAPGAPRVMLLHGFPEAAFVWDEVIHTLGPSLHCVAPNLRGYPGSTAPTATADYRPRLLVQDLIAAIEALGAPLDLLVAHDWGGALAWNLAAARPDLLRRLLIINAPHPAAFLRDLRHSAAQQAASAYMNFLCRPDAAQLLSADSFARLWRLFGPAAWLTPAVQHRYEQGWGSQGVGLAGPLNYYRASPLRPSTDAAAALHTLDLPDAVVTVSVPTTVLWGERDTALLPQLLNGIDRWIPHLTIHRVPDAGHWVVHEQPARVVQAIRDALASGV